MLSRFSQLTESRMGTLLKWANNSIFLIITKDSEDNQVIGKKMDAIVTYQEAFSVTSESAVRS